MWRRQSESPPPKTSAAVLEKAADVLLCGWSAKKGGPLDLFSYSRYFVLTPGQGLMWYEQLKGSEELLLSGSLPLAHLVSIKRDRPASNTDFTFRVETKTGSVRIDPGSRAAFQQWQEGLTAAVAVPSPQEQRQKIVHHERMSMSGGTADEDE